jgi:hypothetical protein
MTGCIAFAEKASQRAVNELNKIAPTKVEVRGKPIEII